MDHPESATEGNLPDRATIDSEDFETVVLVSGVGEQKQSTCYAKDLYTAADFERKREYAELFDDSWSILSAKFGALSPTGAYVDPYDLMIDDYPLDPDEEPDVRYETLDAWAASVLEGIENRVHNYERWDSYGSLGRIVLLVEDEFLAPLREGLDELADEHGFEVVTPFDGMRDTDERMQWLTEQIERAQTQPQSPDATPSEPGSETATNGSEESSEDQSDLSAWS